MRARSWLGRAHAARAGNPWWRTLRVVGGALFGLELSYLVLANLFLNFNGLSLAFAGTNQVNATVASGFSVVPGRVYVRKVRITFQDHNLEFAIDVERAFVVVQLRELLGHTFHGSHLRAEGLSFRMRHRVDPWLQHAPSVGAFAPIPEFSAPAVFEAYVPEPPISDADYHLWSVHLDDVDVGVSELWVQAFRYTGKGRARGQFQLKPARKLWVGPASLDLEPGVLSAGTYRVLSGLRGHIDCTVHSFDVRVPRGMAVLRNISAHVRLDSPEVDPRALALFAAAPAPRVSSEGGTLHLDVAIRHGVLTAESRVDVLQRQFAFRATQGELLAERLELHAGSEGPASSQVSVRIEGGALREHNRPGYPPRIEQLSAALVSDNRDAARDFRFQEARLDEARLWLGNASWLNRWLTGQNVALKGGGISLLASGHYLNKRIAGSAQLESAGIEANVGNQPLHYAGSLALEGTAIDPEALTGSVVADVTGRSIGAGEFKLVGLQLHLTASRDASGHSAHGEARLSNLSTTGGGLILRAPEVHAALDSTRGPGGLQRTRFRARIPTFSVEGRGLRLTTAVTFRGTFAQQKNEPEQRLELWATLQNPNASFGSKSLSAMATSDVSLHAALTSDARGALSGQLGLSPAAWHVDSGNIRLSGQSALAAQFSALDLASNSGQVAARLTSSAVTLGDTTQNANCPWSRVQSLAIAGTARLLAGGSSALSMTGELRQAELNWGDFLTRGEMAFKASFDPGLLEQEGQGSLDLTLRNASLQSGAGGALGWATSVPALDLQATLARQAGKLSGTANLRAPAAKGRIGGTHLSTDLVANFKLAGLDLRASSAYGSGAVHLRNTALLNVPEPVSDWWADIRLDSIVGRAEQNLELSGTFRADLRDATPGLSVLASQGSLPHWVASVFPLRGLSVTGSLARRCRLTDIHLVRMSGGPALARGRLQSLPDGFQGALLLRLAGLEAISAGLDFDAEHTHFGLFRTDAWLARENLTFDRKSADAVGLSCPPDRNLCSEPSQSSLATTSAR